MLKLDLVDAGMKSLHVWPVFWSTPTLNFKVTSTKLGHFEKIKDNFSANMLCKNLLQNCSAQFKPLSHFFYVGHPKEDIFPGHLLCPIFQSPYMLQITNFQMTTALAHTF